MIEWRDNFSTDGRFMIQTATIRDQGTEHRLQEAADPPGPPWGRLRGTYNTRGEAKRRAEKIAEGGQ